MKGSFFRRAKEWMMEYAYLMTLSAVIAVIAASALYTRQLKEKTEAGVQAAAKAPEVEATASPVPTASVSPLPTIAPLTPHYMTYSKGGSTVRPTSGGILRAYAPMTPVYWEALSCVQTHAGIDLAGQADEEVLCAMDGTVQSAVRDELWGWRITVAQTNGQHTVYAGLSGCDVIAGQNVTRGQTLGTLMEAIPCEAEVQAHLHLELYEGEDSRDPTTLLPKD